MYCSLRWHYVFKFQMMKVYICWLSEDILDLVQKPSGHDIIYNNVIKRALYVYVIL